VNKKKALLIGNGINRLEPDESYSWGDILSELSGESGFPVDLDNSLKPFPLAFDEVLHAQKNEFELDEKLKKLKKMIRKAIEKKIENKRGYNKYHKDLVNLGYDDILTTNYDYAFQLSVDEDFHNKKRKWAVNKEESKNSLKRCYEIPTTRTKIWHIHGELYNSRKSSSNSQRYDEESIMIGYAHYVSYLNKMNEKINGKNGKQTVSNKSLMVRLRDKVDSLFWMDIFFTHDVDIVGQGLDFSENHLWWIINHRANMLADGRRKNNIDIRNSITFFYPEIKQDNKAEDDDEVFKRRVDSLKLKAVADLLRAFRVDTVPIDCHAYDEFYEKFIHGRLSEMRSSIAGDVRAWA
jgi:hypothetical protein